ncbi:DUF6975 family protein [Sphingomonas sp. TZW2008]|uniref:DUF6975 family protein n=1 Tax=Sphingomonas sp. TZW2008 TaxID=1917973 RepID=UPI000A271DA9|nr:hypothetical protein [Sphingomonas sp. TZW2008]
MISSAGSTALGPSIVDIVTDDGSLSAAHARRMMQPGASGRDLADAVHAFCSLHGTAPSIVALARAATADADVRLWLGDAALAFDQERERLIALTVAIGPVPSTPGQTEATTAIIGQRHALATLARSDRLGCAVGAALAFLADWQRIRPMFDAAAERASTPIAPSTLPRLADIARIADRAATTPAAERAMRFGAQQLVAQHRGLWHLLDARASARTD